MEELNKIINDLEYAAFNLCNGKKDTDLPIGIIESTGADDTLLIAIRDLKELANRHEPLVRQGRSLPDVACGRVKECEHFLGLTEKLSWLKESEDHDLFVSMIKMRIEFLKQDDNVKKAMTDTLKELINESKPSA
jgi:hypothetical protein